VFERGNFNQQEKEKSMQEMRGKGETVRNRHQAQGTGQGIEGLYRQGAMEKQTRSGNDRRKWNQGGKGGEIF